jgi:hypothetical protein
MSTAAFSRAVMASSIPMVKPFPVRPVTLAAPRMVEASGTWAKLAPLGSDPWGCRPMRRL